MANNMPKPWIKKTVLRCLDDDPLPNKAPVKHKSVLTQVIGVFPDVRILLINDKEHMISVALTEDCAKELYAKDIPLKSLKNCIISLQDWHVSSLIVGAADRDFNRVRQYNISLPLTIQTDRIILYGAEGISVVGDPRDINRDPDIKVLMDCPHITFVETLVRRQFPGEYFLPDYRGIFSVPAPFSESNPLTVEDAIIPVDQMEILDSQPGKNLFSSMELPPDNHELAGGGSSSSSSGDMTRTQVESTQPEATQIDGADMETTQLENTQLDGDHEVDNNDQSQTQLEHTQLDPSLEVYGQQPTTGKFTLEFLVDDHDEYCAVCGEGGNLMLCDFCPKVYHKNCVGLKRVPRGQWRCPPCFENRIQMEDKQLDPPVTPSSASPGKEKPVDAARQERSFTPRPRGVLELENWSYSNNLVGKIIRKRFENNSTIGIGEVVSYDKDKDLYNVRYENGYDEEMHQEGVMLYLLDAEHNGLKAQGARQISQKNVDKLNAKKNSTKEVQVIQGYDAYGGVQTSTVTMDQTNVNWLDAILPLDVNNFTKKSRASHPNIGNNKNEVIVRGIASSSSSNRNDRKDILSKTVGRQGSKRRHKRVPPKKSTKRNAKKATVPPPPRRKNRGRVSKKIVNYKEASLRPQKR